MTNQTPYRRLLRGPGYLAYLLRRRAQNAHARRLGFRNYAAWQGDND